MLLSKEHGVNPSVSVCKVCGKDDGLVLFGAAIKGEAPRQHLSNEPCKDCQDRFDLYLDEKPNHFIILIVENLYEQHQLDRDPPSFWLYFKAAYFTDLETVKNVFKDDNLQQRKAVLSEATAKHIGIDLDALPKGKIQ